MSTDLNIVINKKRNNKVALLKPKEDENLHIENMIEKWGAHRWYRMVNNTEDDCPTAEKLRDEEAQRNYEEDIRERLEEKLLKWEEEKRYMAEQKYIEEQTANMDEEEKRLWMLDYKWKKDCEREDELDAASQISYKMAQMLIKQHDEDEARLAAWEAKNKFIINS